MRWGRVGWRRKAPRPSAQRGARFEFLGGGVWIGASWTIEACQRYNVGFVSEHAEFPEFHWRELHVYFCLLPCLPLHVVWGLK